MTNLQKEMYFCYCDVISKILEFGIDSCFYIENFPCTTIEDTLPDNIQKSVRAFIDKFNSGTSLTTENFNSFKEALRLMFEIKCTTTESVKEVIGSLYDEFLDVVEDWKNY